MTKYVQKMKNSGHDEKMRREVIDEGVKRYREQVNKDDRGEQPLYRSCHDDRVVRKEQKVYKRRNWYRQKKDKRRSKEALGDKDDNKLQAVIPVPYTKNGALLKLFKKRAASSGIDVKFVEKSGYSLQNQLEKSDPFRGPTCGRPDCFPCREGEGTDCESRGPVYEIRCLDDACRDLAPRYHGESGRNAFTRGLDQAKGYAKGDKANTMVKHANEDHDGRKDVKFAMSVIRTFKRDNIRRMIFEAIKIVRNEGLVMNSKAEYKQALLPLMMVHRGPLDRE